MAADPIGLPQAQSLNPQHAPAKRRSAWIGVLALLLGLAVAAWGGRNVYETVQIGAAFVAKHTCSCIFVAGRTAESCSGDYDQQQAQLLRVKTAPNSVTVSVLAGVLSERAEFEAGFGCHLVN